MGSSDSQQHLLLVFPVGMLHVPHQAVPAGESQLATLVLAIVLFVVNLTVKKNVFDPGVGETANATNDFTTVARLLAAAAAAVARHSRVHNVVVIEHFLAIGSRLAVGWQAVGRVGIQAGHVAILRRPLPNVQPKGAFYRGQSLTWHAEQFGTSDSGRRYLFGKLLVELIASLRIA